MCILGIAQECFRKGSVPHKEKVRAPKREGHPKEDNGEHNEQVQAEHGGGRFRVSVPAHEGEEAEECVRRGHIQ